MPGPLIATWRARVARLCACALLALTLTAGMSPVALAVGGNGEGGAFSELSQSGQEEATKTQKTETTASTEPTSNSKKTVIIALVAAVVLLIAIAFVIVRDARRVAPAGDPQLAEARSAHDSAATLRRRRAKAKAARKQRKRTR
jgi:H+/Cl- antiporter ClcA